MGVLKRWNLNRILDHIKCISVNNIVIGKKNSLNESYFYFECTFITTLRKKLPMVPNTKHIYNNA